MSTPCNTFTTNRHTTEINTLKHMVSHLVEKLGGECEINIQEMLMASEFTISSIEGKPGTYLFKVNHDKAH